MGLIIDTSAVVEIERKKLDWSHLISRAGNEQVFLPAIVWGELLAGVHLASTVERALQRRKRLEQIRSQLIILPFNSEIAEVWAELFSEMQKKGTPLSANDLCVISTARFHRYKILISSNDEAHFRRVTNVDLVML